MSDTEYTMTREETFKLVNTVLASTLRGEPQKTELSSGKIFLVAENLEDALDGVTRVIAEEFDGFGEKVTEDFQAQETIQQKVDEMTASIVLRIRQQCEQLRLKF